MKLQKKITSTLLIAVLAASTTFALDMNTPDVVSGGLHSFADSLTTAIPQAATQQDVWADAYIGKLFPSLVPHFGGGINAGVTHIDLSGLSDAADELGIDDIPSSFYLPTIAADIRLGGILFPFDLGFHFMKVNTLEFDNMNINLGMDFFTIGADLRWAVYKGNLLLPKISVGGGYIYTEGSFTTESSDVNMEVKYKTQTAYAQVQASKKLFVFTPFLGLRALVSSSDNDWNWTTSGTTKSILDAIPGTASSDKGNVSTDWDFAELQPQIYAGCGFNVLFLQATLSITADLRHITDDGLWSGALSLRAKL